MVGAFFNAMPKACQSYLNDMSALMVKQLKSNDQALRAAAMNSLAHIMNTAAKPAQSCHLDVVKGMAKVAVGDRSEEVRRAGAAVILVVGAHSAETGFTSVGLEALVQVCTKGEDGGRECNREGTGQIGRGTRMTEAGPSMALSRGVHCNISYRSVRLTRIHFTRFLPLCVTLTISYRSSNTPHSSISSPPPPPPLPHSSGLDDEIGECQIAFATTLGKLIAMAVRTPGPAEGSAASSGSQGSSDLFARKKAAPLTFDLSNALRYFGTQLSTTTNRSIRAALGFALTAFLCHLAPTLTDEEVRGWRVACVCVCLCVCVCECAFTMIEQWPHVLLWVQNFASAPYVWPLFIIHPRPVYPTHSPLTAGNGVHLIHFSPFSHTSSLGHSAASHLTRFV